MHLKIKVKKSVLKHLKIDLIMKQQCQCKNINVTRIMQNIITTIFGTNILN